MNMYVLPVCSWWAPFPLSEKDVEETEHEEQTQDLIFLKETPYWIFTDIFFSTYLQKENDQTEVCPVIGQMQNLTKGLLLLIGRVSQWSDEKNLHHQVTWRRT